PALQDRQPQAGEIDPRVDGQLERGPEAAVDLHQPRRLHPLVAGIDHPPAVPPPPPPHPFRQGPQPLGRGDPPPPTPPPPPPSAGPRWANRAPARPGRHRGKGPLPCPGPNPWGGGQGAPCLRSSTAASSSPRPLT